MSPRRAAFVWIALAAALVAVGLVVFAFMQGVGSVLCVDCGPDETGATSMHYAGVSAAVCAGAVFAAFASKVKPPLPRADVVK